MGLFDFLKPKPQSTPTSPITEYANRLTLDEKASIYTTMLFMTTQQSTRTPHPAERKYVDNIRTKILGLSHEELKRVSLEHLNFPAILQSLSAPDKEFFALVLYNLATIIQDQAIVKAASMFVGDMGFTLEELAQKASETQNEINNNPYIDKKFKTNQ